MNAILRLLGLFLLLGSSSVSDVEFSRRLQDLAAADGAQRAQAERWLAANLDLARYPVLAEAVLGGEAETARRVANAIGSDGAHFSLAMLFLDEREPRLQEVGRGAVRRILMRWNRDVDKKGLQGPRLEERYDQMTRLQASDVVLCDPAAPLEVTLARMGRSAAFPFGIVLDPFARSRRAPSTIRAEPWRGTWREVLDEVVNDHGLALEAFGLDEPSPGQPVPQGFLRITSARELDKSRGSDLLLRWCSLLSEPGDLERRVAAARALAASGWPDALAWMEERWSTDGDAASFEGLMLAAAEGRVVHGLARPAGIGQLVARAEREFGRGPSVDREILAEVLAALGKAGGRGPGGEDLAAAVLAGWEQAGTQGRWLRLAALERQSLGAAQAEGPRRRIRELLASGPPRALALQALRTWSALGAGGAIEWDPRVVVLGLDSVADVRDRLDMLLRAGLRPPDAWRLAQDLDPRWGTLERLFVLSWWLGCGEEPAAARQLVEFLRRQGHGQREQETLGQVLAGWRAAGRPQDAEAVLRLARSYVNGESELLALERSAVLAGVEPGVLEEILGRAPRGPLAWAGDVPLLGAVGGRGGGQGARLLLVAGLDEFLGAENGGRPPQELVEALRAAMEGLYALGLDPEARAFYSQVREVVGRRGSGPWVEAVRGRSWPDPPRLDRRTLGELEGLLDLEGL